jgi:hypothetical protein
LCEFHSIFVTVIHFGVRTHLLFFPNDLCSLCRKNLCDELRVSLRVIQVERMIVLVSIDSNR